MDSIEQQFIVDFAKNTGVQIPSTLMQSSFKDTLNDIGYELPPSTIFSSYVSALNKRYPDRYIVPFAKSASSDDIAALVVEDKNSEGPIIEIHDFASTGFENPRYFKSISSWISFRLRIHSQ